MMSEARTDALPAPRKLWQRILLMVVLAIAFQLSGWLLFLTAVAQVIFVLATGAPNTRLLRWGRSLGWYLGQITRFETFATEALPFPFTDWPSEAIVKDQENGSAYG